MGYTKESIEAVRERLDMVEVVSTQTELKRVGSRWTGLCPFHDERTPSFSVNAEEKLYHCFGCGEGGDAIGFVMATEQLGFPEAVELLAERYGVELKRDQEDPDAERRRKRRERLHALLDRAASFYSAYLWDGAEAAAARDYLTGRGLTEETLRAFRVGYAPKAWDALARGARGQGFTNDELYAAGLVRKGRSGEPYDFFRERITFPLADGRGRVLGFGARALSPEQTAKYVNTPESELFSKSRTLFGLDVARGPAGKSGRVIVTEGYTDVLALHQAGHPEAIAIMGTALTEDQLGALARVVGDSGRILLALDADEAGRKAMLRGAALAEDRGIEMRVVRMPTGSDPADLIAAEGAEAIEALLGDTASVLEFAVDAVIEAADLSSPEGKDRALDQVRELIGRAPERSARRDHLVRFAADRLDVPPEYLGPGIGNVGRRTAPARSRSATVGEAPAVVPGPAGSEAERIFMAQCLGAGPDGLERLRSLTAEHLSSPALGRALEHLTAHFDDPLDGLPSGDRELDATVSGIALDSDHRERAEPASLRIGFLQLESRRIERQLRRARASGDLEQQRRLASDRQRVRTEMDAAMGQA